MPFFIHHVNNPYLYNPAFAGFDQHAILTLTHREQWIGIEGAPSSTNLSFHTSTGHGSPLSFGADITSDRIGILNNTTLRATFGYMVPLGMKREHYLRFGLSGGIASQQFDLREVSIEDDWVLQNILKRSTFMDGRFGIHYHVGDLNLGFALPHIFGNPMRNPDGLDISQLKTMDRFIASANYRINLNSIESLAFEPTILYNISREMGNQLEAFGILQIKEAFWIGGGYQQQSGIAGLLGFKIKDLKIGYSYGAGGNAIAGQSGGIHEAQIALFIGKKWKEMKRKPRLSTTPNSAKLSNAAIAAAKNAKEENEHQNITEAAVPALKRNSVLQDSIASSVRDTLQENRSNVLTPPTDNQLEKPNTDLQETSEAVKPQQEINYEQLTFEPLEDHATVQLGKKDQSKIASNSQGFIDSNLDSLLTQENQQAKEDTTAMSLEKLVRVAPPKVADQPLALKEGKYIIVGTFSQESSTQQLIQKLQAEGYQADLMYHLERKLYYVPIMSSNDVEELKTKLQDLKNSPLFENAWILSVEE